MNDFDFVGAAALDMMRAALAGRLPQGADVPFRRVARDYLQVQTEDNRVVPFLLRPLQLEYLARKRLARMRGRPSRFLLLKSRRMGFTTLEQGLSYYAASRRRNITLMTMAQDAKMTAQIFRIALLMHERDPKAPRIKGPGNQYRLEFPGLRSLFYVDTAGARGVGRGATLSKIHWSEVAWSCEGGNQRDEQRRLLTGMQEAARHKSAEIVLETTPNGFELFRELYKEARLGRNDWTPIFFPWFADEANRDPVAGREEAEAILAHEFDEDEARLRRRVGLDAGQVKWRRRKVRELKQEFPQEYPSDDEECWIVTGSPFFDPRRVSDLRDELREPEMVDDPRLGLVPFGATHLPGGYEVEWEPPMAGKEYAMGVDTSEGIPGCDPNGIGVMRRDTGAQVYSAHGLFHPRALADLVARAGERYNRALVGVERENHGFAVIQRLLELGYGREHFLGGELYYHSPARENRRDDRPVARAGWSTNQVTRPLMLEALRDWLFLPDAELRVRDRHFLSECLSFRLQPNGRFEADSGSHDDSVVKWAIANQMRLVDWNREQITVHGVSRWSV